MGIMWFLSDCHRFFPIAVAVIRTLWLENGFNNRAFPIGLPVPVFRSSSGGDPSSDNGARAFGLTPALPTMIPSRTSHDSEKSSDLYPQIHTQLTQRVIGDSNLCILARLCPTTRTRSAYRPSRCRVSWGCIGLDPWSFQRRHLRGICLGPWQL